MTGNSSKIRAIFWAKAFFAALGSFLGAAGLSAGSTSAASLKLLWSFCAVVSCNDGKFPVAGPISDGKGNLYGTTPYGGGANNGVVFFLSPTKSFQVLHAFGAGGGLIGADGGNPTAPLLGTGTGNLYGTNFYGGAFAVGTVFVRSASGVYTVVHWFTGPDGSHPNAGLTSGGGASGSGGTIFKIAPVSSSTTEISTGRPLMAAVHLASAWCSRSGRMGAIIPFSTLLWAAPVMGGNPTPVFPPMLPATSMARPTSAVRMVAAPCSRSRRMGALMPFCTTSAA
jgi:uncharacterized repeat protein (TIGR03803 family)